LCEALAALGTLHRTDELAPEALALDLTASTDGDAPFVEAMP